MNANVVADFSCSCSVVLEETYRRLAEPGRTTATRHRRQVAAPTATTLSLIFTGSSSSSKLRNAPHLQSMVCNKDSSFILLDNPTFVKGLLFCCPIFIFYRTSHLRGHGAAGRPSNVHQRFCHLWIGISRLYLHNFFTGGAKSAKFGFNFWPHSPLMRFRFETKKHIENHVCSVRLDARMIAHVLMHGQRKNNASNTILTM